MRDRTTEAVSWIVSQLGAGRGAGGIPTNLDEITQAIMARATQRDLTPSILTQIAKEARCSRESVNAIVNLLTASKNPFLTFTLLNQAGEVLPNQTFPELIKDPKRAKETLVVWRLTPQTHGN